VERDMVGVLLGDHMSQESRPGQSLWNGLHGLIRGDDMTFTVRAGVGTALVFHDEQRCRLVIELLAALGADLNSGLATFGTSAFGLSQLVDDRDTREILGQSLPAVAALLLLRARGRLVVRVGGGGSLL